MRPASYVCSRMAATASACGSACRTIRICPAARRLSTWKASRLAEKGSGSHAAIRRRIRTRLNDPEAALAELAEVNSDTSRQLLARLSLSQDGCGAWQPPTGERPNLRARRSRSSANAAAWANNCVPILFRVLSSRSRRGRRVSMPRGSQLRESSFSPAHAAGCCTAGRGLEPNSARNTDALRLLHDLAVENAP